MKSLFGNIFIHQKWRYTFDEYESDIKEKKISKAIIKVFSGR
jgi:hypothetical protein